MNNIFAIHHYNSSRLVHSNLLEGLELAYSASTLRNHSYWQTDFEGITFFGQGDEFSWGNTTVDLSVPVNVTWKYRWSMPGCHFYFDHVKVEI